MKKVENWRIMELVDLKDANGVYAIVWAVAHKAYDDMTPDVLRKMC